MDDRLKRFQERIRERFTILVCRVCGSTSVDNYFIDTLGCTDCGARAKLSPDLFHSVRCYSEGIVPAGIFKKDAETILGLVKAPSVAPAKQTRKKASTRKKR